MHFYVFYIINGDYVYERTCGVVKAAQERVNELKKRYDDAIFFENNIPKDLKWFY